MKLQKAPRISGGKFHAAVVVGIALLAGGMAYAATTYTVASGESLMLDHESNNEYGNQITLQDGATLMVPVNGSDGYRIKANLYVAGAARIVPDPEATLPSAWYLRLPSGIIASNDTCSLTIGGGLTQVFFGLQAGDKTPEADVAVDGTGIHYPIINLKNLYFDATARGTFVLRSSSACTVVQLPTTCDIKFNDTNVTLALKGADALGQLGQSSPYCLPNFNAVVLDSLAITPGSIVKVAAGRTLAIKPCNISSTWNWGGTAADVRFDVELEGEDSLLLFRSKNVGWTRFVGNVTGEGRVYVRGENDSSGSRVTLNGDITCRGGLGKTSIAEVRYGPDAGWRSKVKHWFDAADTNSYVKFAAEPPSGRTTQVGDVLPRTATGVDTTRGWFGGARGSETTDRSPWIDEGSRNGGPSRHWINFQDLYLQDNNGKYYGNMLRYKNVEFNENNVKSTSFTTFNMQQVFMVLDTSAGGGTPLLDTTGADGIVKSRIGKNLPGDDWTKSIHANGGRKTEGVFLGGKAWLDKTGVDPYTHGFTGKPEILTLETTGNFPAGVLGYYGKKDNDKLANFEIMGEVIFYSAPLSAEDRAKVQDYLMYKWLGKVDNAVYSDASAATLAGSGRVTAGGFDDPALPALSSAFTGTLAVTNDLAFTVGSPVTCGHAVELPQACTITVDVPANTEGGTYTLLSASSVAGGENATLAFTPAAERIYEGQFVLSGNALSIALKRIKGVTIIVR